MDGDGIQPLVSRDGALQMVGGNTPVLLTDASSVWFVESGSVDVFSIRLSAGQPVGARAHFCSVPAGQLFFGIEPAPDRALLAVGVVNTRLRRLPLAWWRELAGDPRHGAAVAALLDVWIASVSAGVTQDISPRTDLMLRPTSDLELARGTSFRSRRGVLWLAVNKGDLIFIGIEEVAPAGRTALFPVTSDTWFSALEPVFLSVSETGAEVAEAPLWEGLARFHRLVLACETANRRFADVDDHNLARERAGASEQAARRALINLASVLDEASPEFDSPVEDPVFLACHAVARHRSIELQPPPEMLRGESLADPLAAIARASRVRTRRVVLEGKWWTRDAGPLVAFLADGHHPVALIPVSPRAYELHDPRKRSRQRLTPELAAALEPAGMVFYRSFRDEALTG